MGTNEILAIIKQNTEMLIDINLIQQSEINAAELKLLMYILNKQKQNLQEYVSLNFTAVGFEIGCSELTIKRQIKKLSESGIIEQEKTRSTNWRVRPELVKSIKTE